MPPSSDDRFGPYLADRGLERLRRAELSTLQVNVGKLCNQACHHCHVEAGPKRTEIMTEATADRLLEVFDRTPGIGTVDLTGGAPEMCPSFRRLVTHFRAAGSQVILRCNLTILREPGYEDMVDFFREQGVHVIASLPCYTADNVDKQRGKGVFGASIDALLALNEAGIGQDGSELRLDLVYNPLGAFLPGDQAALEAGYKERLKEDFGIVFHRLLTITNMPIKRFAEQLRREGQEEAYHQLLVDAFREENVDGVMCRSLVSVSWDGQIFDCDFNQMLEMSVPEEAAGSDLWSIESFADLVDAPIATADHCFGCTAGAGSSCGGALDTMSV